MEFKKTRRRNVWVVIAAMILLQCVWILRIFNSADRIRDGWMICLYQFPLLNSIIMPVAAAVIASRLCDVEHKGQALKLLETVMLPGKLFDAKFLCGSCFIFAATFLQFLIFLVTGYLLHFTGPVPAGRLLCYLLFTATVNVTILLFQQILSLLFVNQMVSLSAGLIGALVGLFIMFFPPEFERLLLWGYYGVLMLVRMDWNSTTRVIRYYWITADWNGYLTLTAMFCVLYLIGRMLFIRKEI